MRRSRYDKPRTIRPSPRKESARGRVRELKEVVRARRTYFAQTDCRLVTRIGDQYLRAVQRRFPQSAGGKNATSARPPTHCGQILAGSQVFLYASSTRPLTRTIRPSLAKESASFGMEETSHPKRHLGHLERHSQTGICSAV